MKYAVLRFALIVSSLATVSSQAQELKLWPGGAPGSENDTTPEGIQQPDPAKPPTRITYVSQPTISVFLPAKEKATGMAIVIAPGGGHAFLSIDLEGYQLAHFLNDHGIAAFVLKYRLAKAQGSHYTVPDHALPDSWRAIRMVRSKAAEWGINPARVGFMGFSAGGELAALVETRFDAGNPASPDPVEKMSSRPDFTVIVYPGFRPGTITVPKDAPPAFLVCANDDPSHVVTTVNLYLDLQKQGISSEMHIYASGGHGFGIRESHKPSATWDTRMLEWMADRKL
jgi:endo-1,4-beta-xylanase